MTNNDIDEPEDGEEASPKAGDKASDRTGDKASRLGIVKRAIPLMAAAVMLMLAFIASPAKGQEADDEYRVGAGDKLSIIVFGHTDLSREVLVDGSGRVSLPLLGQIEVEGRTVAELQEDVTEALNRDFIVDPRVSIEVVTYRPFFILGQVNKPGRYPYIEGMTVRMAVALAGGFTRRAEEDTAVVIRGDDPEGERSTVELDTSIEPGDTVEVERRLF